MALINELAERLQIGFTRKIPLIYQSESAECGLACVAMIAEYFGHKLNLTLLRSEISVSLNGSTLNDLMNMAQKLDLNSRPLRASIEELSHSQLPCIIHWDFNHFVVLVRVAGNRFYIHDPSAGRRRLTKEAFSQHFTGVILELTPLDKIKKVVHNIHRPRFSDVFGKPRSLFPSLSKVVILALVFEICVLGSSFLPQIVIDQVIPSQDINLLYLVVLGFSLLLLVRVGASFLRSWTVMAVSASFNLQWHTRVFSHLVNLPIPFFEKRNLGDITSRFGSLDVIESAITKQLVSVLLDGLFSIGALMMMFFYDAHIAIIALASLTLYLLLRQILFSSFRERNLDFILSSAKEKTYFLETVRSIQSIRLFCRTTNRITRWQNLLVDERNADIRQQKLGIGFEAMSTLIFGAEGLLIVLIGTAAALKGDMTVGMLITALSFKDQFSSRSSGFIDTLFTLRMMGLHMERVGDVVLSEPEELESTNRSFIDVTQLTPSIEFKNISFRYADNEPFILQNITFTIAAGESVALIGPSGCGKTTLVKLILGILRPSSGQILIGGTPLSCLSVNDYRSLISSVMQDDTLLSGSIEENISFFDLEVNRIHVKEAAVSAAIDRDIECLPMGYETLIGELGNTLSGGQRQRLLLARALYKQPKIIVLDEATSHLDQVCEEEINNMIRLQKLTRIIVAHRPSTIASADRVIDISSITNIYNVDYLNDIKQ